MAVVGMKEIFHSLSYRRKQSERRMSMGQEVRRGSDEELKKH